MVNKAHRSSLVICCFLLIIIPNLNALAAPKLTQNPQNEEKSNYDKIVKQNKIGASGSRSKQAGQCVNDCTP